MTPLFTAPQEMFFVILAFVLFAALVGDFRNARFFRSIRNRPSPWKDLARDLKVLFFLLAACMAWAQNKMLMPSDGESLSNGTLETVVGTGDWLTGSSLETPGGVSYSMTGVGCGESTGITWALLSGLPPFTSNAVLTASQYLGGFACVSVTNIQLSVLNAPANAVVYTNWPYAVARHSVPLPQGCLPAGFTFGGRAVTNLYVSASGMLSFDGPKSSPTPATNGIPDGTAANYISVLQTPSDIVPTNGLFWYAPGTNSSVFTWKDVFLGQDTNCLATVQAELYANGDFACRYYFPSLTNNYVQLTNAFLIGAQNHGGGETVLHTNALLAIHPSFLPAFELRWKAFGDLMTDARAENDFDADGLFDFDELRFGTDPRLADTDGDGLKDGWEVRHGFDPSVSGDTWDDPDSDGRPNIMESYMDTDPYISDGVPDCLTPDEEKTSITFTLAGSLAENAFAVLWFDGTALPFSATNTAWTVYFPLGALYETSFDAPEAYGEGLTISDATRMFLFDPSGVIRFSPPPASSSRSGSFQSSTSPVSGPRTGIFWMGYVDFSVTPLSSLVHRWDAHILFTAEPDSPLSSLADGAFINWTATDGEMSSQTGWVSVFNPFFSEEEYASVTVADIVAYSGSTEVPDTYISSTGTVAICHGHIDLSLNATPNFSPHLGETNTIEIAAAMHNCTHDVTPGEGCTFEIELMRETTSGWQHVAWLDADPRTAGNQDTFTITNGWQGATLQWDGIAAESAAQATSPDVFTQGTQPFNRIFPAVTSGKPLPPPFYTLFTRIRKNDTIYAEASQSIYVPQVVKIQWDAAAVSLFNQDLYTDGSEPLIRIYHTTNTAADAAIASIPSQVQGLFPSEMNIRVTTNSVVGDYKNVLITSGENTITNGFFIIPPRGRLIPPKDYLQTASPKSECRVYLRGERATLLAMYLELATDSTGEVESDIFDETALMWMISKTCAHEVGHSFGLVSIILGGNGTHDVQPFNPKSIMMPGGILTCADILGDAEWLNVQGNYLKFILPK